MSEQLSLGELYKQIGEQLRVRPDKAGDTVCIALAGGVGGTKAVNVRHAHCGGDWDKGKIFNISNRSAYGGGQVTLLDEITGALLVFNKDFDSGVDNSDLNDIYHAGANHISALQDIINRHPQSLTPEQVVEWMASPGNEVDYDYDTALDMQEHTLFIGGREDACIMFRAFADTATFWVNLSGNRELEIPLSCFRNLDELKSFVRILTGEEV